MKYLIVSPGGVATHSMKGLVKEKLLDKHIPKKYPHHLRKPPESFRKFYDGKVRVLYLFGCPYNIILSHFRRRKKTKRWCYLHAKNMDARPNEIDIDWGIEEYLDNGEDLLGIEDQFDNWASANPSADHDILMVKYETMSKHMTGIRDFLRTDKEIKLRERSSDYTRESERIQNLLEKVYGNLKKKVDEHPEIKRI